MVFHIPRLNCNDCIQEGDAILIPKPVAYPGIED